MIYYLFYLLKNICLNLLVYFLLRVIFHSIYIIFRYLVRIPSLCRKKRQLSKTSIPISNNARRTKRFYIDSAERRKWWYNSAIWTTVAIYLRNWINATLPALNLFESTARPSCNFINLLNILRIFRFFWHYL